MKILVIETSTERGMVACLDEESLIASIELPFGLLSSQFLLPELHRLFQQNEILPFDLIVVGIGPGSYTGIRVGATAAKTLSFAMQIPLVGISSLDGFIPKSGQKRPFAAVIDAKVGGVYVKQEQQLPQLLSLEEGMMALESVPLLVTPNASSLQLKMKAGDYPWIWEEVYPCPQRLALLGKEKFLQGGYSLDGSLDLMYMRKTQAEIERDSR